MAIARGAFSFHISRSYCTSVGNHPLFHTSSTADTQKDKSPKDNEQYSVTLNEADFEEKFIRGSGPGGQKVNKSNNCVELKHIPTGVVVKCHETRSQEKNREIARKKLLEKLKFLFNPSESNVVKKQDEKRKRQSDAVRRRRLKDEARDNKLQID